MWRSPQILYALFSVRHEEDKTLGLAYNQLGYLGHHFEVTLPEDRTVDDGNRLHGLLCEVQIHTRAQNCWAEVSHQLIYKSDEEPPQEVKRRVYRLMALIELFDESAQTAGDTMLHLPTFEEGRMLHELERWFYRLTARSYDRDLSLGLLAALKDAYTADERSGFAPLLDTFAANHQRKLEDIYRHYRTDDRCSPLLFQPEALLAFERLEHDAFHFKDLWLSRLPDTLLTSLGAIWGLSL